MDVHLSGERFPFQFRGKNIEIKRIELFVRLSRSIDQSLLKGMKVGVVHPSDTTGGPPASTGPQLGHHPVLGILSTTVEVNQNEPYEGLWRVQINSEEINQLRTELPADAIKELLRSVTVKVDGTETIIWYFRPNVFEDILILYDYSTGTSSS